MSRFPLSRRFGSGAARRSIHGAVAALTAAALTLVAVPPPAAATTLDAVANLSAVAAAPEPAFTPVGPSIPVIDSAVGRGEPLATDPGGTVYLGSAAEPHAAALVRLTLFEPGQAAELTAYTAADTAVLHMGGSTAVSTTVLLPLNEGRASLWADGEADVRVEPLAYFDGAQASGGATLALPEPVLRADTTRGIAGNALGQEPLWLGLTGDGGVASVLARSVHVLLDVTLAAGDTVILGDGQRLALPAGRSVVSTVVDAEDQGGVTAALETAGNTGSLRASVTGWVSEAAEDSAKSNHSGSYVVNTETRNPSTARLTAGEDPARIRLADDHDAAYALVLTQTGDVRGNETSTLAWGAGVGGRASGEAVDKASGTQPQLSLVPVVRGESQVSIRRGSAAVVLQPLGSFLGSPAPYDASTPASIDITSPLDRQNLDLTETGYFTLEGTVSTGANSVDRIVISSPSVGFIGLAELNPAGDEILWSFRSLAPEDGDFDYVATVFDRSDPGAARASDRVRLTLDVAEEGDTVVSPEAQVFHLDATALEFEVLDEFSLRFAERPELEPGDIIVSAPMPTAPSGFLGRMSAMDLVAGSWEVSTVEVPLEELFLQVDIDESEDYGEGEEIVAHDLLAQAENPMDVVTGSYAALHEDGTDGPETPVTEVQIVDQDGNPHTPVEGTYAEIVNGDDVDLELSSDEFNVPNPAEFETACRLAGSDGQEPQGQDIGENGEWTAPAAPAPGDGDCGGQLRGGPGASLSADWTTKVDVGVVFLIENGVAKVKTAGKKQDWKDFEAWSATDHGNEQGVAIRAGGELNIGFKFTLKTNMKFKWKVIPRGISINEFRIEFKTKLKASASVQAWLQLQGRWNLKLQVAEVALPTTTFFAGPVPVAITNRLNFAVGVTGTLKAMAEIPAIGIERADTFGFKYSSAKGPERIKEDTPTKYILPTPRQAADNREFSLEGEVAAGPEMTYQSRIYSFAGPDMTLSAKAGFGGKVTVTDSPAEAELKAGVFLALGLEGSAKLTLIKWELLHLTLFQIGYRLNLIEYEHTWKL